MLVSTLHLLMHSRGCTAGISNPWNKLKNHLHLCTRGPVHLQESIFWVIPVEQNSPLALLESLPMHPMVAVILCQDGMMVHANQPAIDMGGYSLNELKGMGKQKGIKIIHPEDRDTFTAWLNELHGRSGKFARKNHQVHDCRIITKEGRMKWMSISARKLTLDGKRAILVNAVDISEMKKLDAGLVEKQQILDIIMEQDLVGISILQDNQFKFMNKYSGELSGFPVEEIKEWSPDQIYKKIHPDDLPIILKNAKRPHDPKTGYTSRFNYRIITKPGKITWLQHYGKAITYNGRPGVLLLNVDITEKENALRDLESSEKKFRLIAENAVSGIIITQNKKIIFINNQCATIFGYTIDEMANWTREHLRMKIHPDDRRKDILTCPKDCKVPCEHVHSAFRIIAKDGKIKKLDGFTTCIPIKGDHTELTLFIDNTRLKNALDKVKQSESKYRHIIESSPAAIILMNTKGRILDCNKATSNIFNLPKEEIIDKKFKEFHQDLKMNRGEITKLFNDIMSGAESAPVEIEITEGDHDSKWVSVNFRRIQINSHEMVQMIIHDITSQKMLEMVLEEEIIKLRDLDRLRRNLISNAAHELKTPLVSIYSATDFLLKSLQHEIGDSAKNIIEIIYKGGRRMKSLVDEILEASRIEAGQLHLNKTSMDMVDLVKQSINYLEYTITEKNHEIIKHMPAKLHVIADKVRMEQVITNLVSNAINNTPEGGKITIELNRVANSVVFSITDTGVGITDDELPQLFTQFGTIERDEWEGTNPELGGTGLGLFISKNIIEIHGGLIWAESEGRNKGATFKFTIPVNRDIS
ncbi:PAS domain S-box protein [Candidatus Bathyarchaeota archaeon]|nr:PAS domain S-box protein [Candidatus Bathyarchaeota archaeon]